MIIAILVYAAIGLGLAGFTLYKGGPLPKPICFCIAMAIVWPWPLWVHYRKR